jgi:perosamine synthetase
VAEKAPQIGSRRIPVAEPALVGNEREYVLDCLESSWISSSGKYVDAFEASFAEFCGVGHALSCANGTVALHLALLALGVGPGDEVILPTLTYVASANAVMYCGATPVFVDSEPETWNLDPARVADAVTERTKAIMAVHLYGHPADMDPLVELARERGIALVEDAAEAHGAQYRGRTVGSIADVSTFSFYGNKIITTGEGGAVVTNDPELAARIKMLRGQGQDPNRRYWFPVVGYNYRLTNVAAAIGLAQLERVDWHIARRREVAGWYAEFLSDDPRLTLSPELPWARSSFWISCAVLAEDARPRDDVMSRLAERGIETRPFFYPMHTLPMYEHLPRPEKGFPVAESLARRGLNLPTSATLTRDDVRYVAEELASALD